MCENCRRAYREVMKRGTVEHRSTVIGHDGVRVDIEMARGPNPVLSAEERREIHEQNVAGFQEAARLRAELAIAASQRPEVHPSLAADPATCGHEWVRPNGRCYWCNTPVAQ